MSNKITIKDIKNRDFVLTNMLKEIKKCIDINCSHCISTLTINIEYVEFTLNNLLISGFKRLSAENKQLIINRNSFILQSFKENSRLKPTPTTCDNCEVREVLIDDIERILLSDIIALNFQKYTQIK